MMKSLLTVESKSTLWHDTIGAVDKVDYGIVYDHQQESVYIIHGDTPHSPSPYKTSSSDHHDHHYSAHDNVQWYVSPAITHHL